MSMLAERRQKQKFTLNPRGKYWTEDANKFGQKMLEKMGWSAGKGLGAKEDGITEHIKQSYKNDAKGIGFDDKGDQWTKHEMDFTSLLENLSNSNPEVPAKPSLALEQRSQKSRSRVHYHKFTRGKDLTSRSEKDLANIFGRKTLENKTVKVEEVEIETPTEDKKFGVVTVHGGNMREYFKSKLYSYVDRKIKEQVHESDDEKPSFGLGFTQTEIVVEETEIKEEDVEEPKFAPVNEKPEKKKKNKTKVVINECFDNPGFEDFAQEETEKNSDCFDNAGFVDFTNEEKCESASDNSVKTKKKKRKLDTISEETNEDTQFTIPKKKKREDPEEVQTKKKKLEKSIDKEHQKWDNVDITLEKSSDKKKSKKSKKTKLCDNNPDSFTDSLDVSIHHKPKKSKKKTYTVMEGLDNFACTENSPPHSDTPESIEKNSKKKSKRVNGVENLACTEFTPSEGTSSKKSKRVNSKRIENLVFTEFTPSEGTTSKKSKRVNAEGIENLACTEISPSESTTSKKSKCVNAEGIETLACAEISRSEPTSSKKSKRVNTEGIENLACTEFSPSEPISNKKSIKTNVTEGFDNRGCTALSVDQAIEETLTSVTNAIDDYQLQLENQMNEQKDKQRTTFKRDFYVRKSVKNVIKGKVKYNFEGANLDMIAGYGVAR